MIAINSLGNESVKGLFIFIQNYASDIVIRVVNSSQFCILYHIVPKKKSVRIRVFFKKKTSVGSISSKVFFIENRNSSTPSIFFRRKKNQTSSRSEIKFNRMKKKGFRFDGNVWFRFFSFKFLNFHSFEVRYPLYWKFEQTYNDKRTRVTVKHVSDEWQKSKKPTITFEIQFSANTLCF